MRNIIYKNDHNKMECFKHVFKRKFVKKKKKEKKEKKKGMHMYFCPSS